MRRYLYGFLAAITLVAATLYSTSAGSVPPAVTSTSVVKLILGQGHGSGVHVGDGYILTAAHVVTDKKTVIIKTSNGARRYGKVLWANSDYDLALVRTNPVGIAVSHLSCRTLAAGEAIRAGGNPVGLEFVTSYGKISGDAREQAPWKLVYITDITTVQGMSGGPTFDKNADVVGITVGVAAVPLSDRKGGYTPSITGFGMVVPSSAVCELMARGV